MWRGDNVYKMTAKTREYCIIIDNYTFASLPARYVSKTDADLLKDVFTQLNFIVEIRKNLLAEEINLVLDFYASKLELASHQCIVVIILSHDYKEMVCGIDFRVEDSIKEVVDVHDIVEKFPIKIVHFRKVPKILFISSSKGC